ncbi:MAG: alpha-glucosidase C-terminal domain-containing protein [Sphingobacteriaceae bacterium]|nr:alpha-glucosidase C-terminal domain-containing protein [Sphingobacteriaceae bacterium]
MFAGTRLRFIYNIDHPQVYCYTRSQGDEKILVILNFSSQNVSYAIDENINTSSTKLLLSNYKTAEIKNQKINLLPWQSAIYKIN